MKGKYLMLRVYRIRLEIDEDILSLKDKCEKAVGCSVKNVTLLKRSIDARRKNDVHYLCCAECEPLGKYSLSENVRKASEDEFAFKGGKTKGRVIIAGSGPAGLFAGLMLARQGYEPIIVERGESVENRVKKIDSFFGGGKLDTQTNIQFGEGGAGTFSDGKLNTGINDARIRVVLKEFVRFGAPEEILYEAMPHIGTDILRNVVKNIREEIIRLGGDVYFNTLLCRIDAPDSRLCGVWLLSDGEEKYMQCDALIAAIGHSSRDTFKMLAQSGVEMEKKTFSVGVRIEHKQSMINRAMYGDFADKLPPAPYKLWQHLKSGKSLYTFCMCPGGYVVNAASETGGVVTNGMSNYMREGENANSALLVNTDGYDGLFGGVKLQRELERKSFEVGGGNYNMPVQNVSDFMCGRASADLEDVIPTVKPGYTPADFRDIFSTDILSVLREGILSFERKIPGFSKCGVLTAPETRSSSPVKILRDKETLMTNISGLFTAGEGGGHAGGITSSAVDGIKNAEAVCTYLDKYCIKY